MTELVACLSSNEKSWGHIEKLIGGQEWSNVFLVASEFASKNFKAKNKVTFIVVDFEKPVFELISQIKNSLSGRITDLEVALNLVSGTGKDHMALLSALLKLGVGVRLMAATKEGVKEL